MVTKKSHKDTSAPKKKRGNPKLRKGEQPEWLKQHSFSVRPDHINRLGIASDIATLRQIILKLGNEGIVVGKVKTPTGGEQEVVMTRFERIIYDWFNSQSFDKQKAIMEYGIGKVKDNLDITTDGKPLTWQEFVKSANGSASNSDTE